MTTTYNGYSNHATWCVCLWIDNDEYAINHWQRMATTIARRAADRDDAAYKLAAMLREEHMDALPIEPTGLYADLLLAALSDVDWQEVAVHILDGLDE